MRLVVVGEDWQRRAGKRGRYYMGSISKDTGFKSELRDKSPQVEHAMAAIYLGKQAPPGAAELSGVLVKLPLDYTPQWMALGIVSIDDIRRDEREALSSDDVHPEHYRWRAFSRFIAEQRALSPVLAHQLYALGATDTDFSMGGSMMAAVLHHSDCPADLLDSALASEHAHLRRIAARRLNRDPLEK